jgi:hypothetical protein
LVYFKAVSLSLSGMTKANHEEHDLDSQSPVFRPYLKDNTAVRHYKDQLVNAV